MSSETAQTHASDYKYWDTIALTGDSVRLAYRDSGVGRPVLLLHGFGSFSYTWDGMLKHMPSGFRYISVDLNGFGFSISNSDSYFSIYDQAELLHRFILELDLDEITIAGHGMGGEVALLLLNMDEVRARVGRLILISCGALLGNTPKYIGKLAELSPDSTVIRFAHSRLIARLILEYGYFNRERLKKSSIDAYSEMLSNGTRMRSIILAAQQYKAPESRILQNILKESSLPVLMIWGADDKLIPPGVMLKVQAGIESVSSRFIPECGHLPQEEFPEETAAFAGAFMLDTLEKFQAVPQIPVQSFAEATASHTMPQAKKLSMWRLFDRWSIESTVFVCVLKVLQFFRRIGLRAKEHGWRKVCGIFLKNECSKFVLGVFRLTYSKGCSDPSCASEAENLLISRIGEFLKSRPELQWFTELRSFYVVRRKAFFCDIVEARIDKTGKIVALTPHLHRKDGGETELSEEQIKRVMDCIIDVYNTHKDEPGKIRPGLISRDINIWVKSESRRSIMTRMAMGAFIKRIMTAMFIYFEEMPSDQAELMKVRFKTPDFKKYRHPGLGMLCVVARFTHDYHETDLWWQFNHVTADGAPMQEMLCALKNEWGTAGELVYPALNGMVSMPDIRYYGDGIFRAVFYVDFQPVMELRKWLNQKYSNAMNGPVSLMGMILWGLARHEYFRNDKMLVPVDTGSDTAGERDLGLLLIRPGMFMNGDSSLADFLKFQHEVNKQLQDTLRRQSESYEFLKLCAMMHPFFYHMAKRLMPNSLNEVLGTMGISIIRDSEMFISPLTDFQINGFMSLGSVAIPTENGRKAGAVCICGRKDQIKHYFDAIREFAGKYPEFLQLPPDWKDI